jgi:hypothetical protein
MRLLRRGSAYGFPRDVLATLAEDDGEAEV